MAIGLSIVGAVVVLIAAALAFVFFRRKRTFSRFQKISSAIGRVQQSGKFCTVHHKRSKKECINFIIGIDPSEVVIHDKLGSGGHSNVFRATFRGTDVAVKVMNNQFFNNSSSLARFDLEVAIMWYVIILIFNFISS